MNYSSIQLLRVKNNLSERKLAQMVGMSASGFNNAMNRGTMTISVLEKLCELFEVPASYFFEDEKNPVSERSPNYGKKCQSCISKDGKIELLTKMIKEKEEIIKQLHIDLGRNAPGKSGKVA